MTTVALGKEARYATNKMIRKQNVYKTKSNVPSETMPTSKHVSCSYFCSILQGHD